MVVFFFFQAEDGIRDLYVTGVQTCALPISEGGREERDEPLWQERFVDLGPEELDVGDGKLPVEPADLLSDGSDEGAGIVGGAGVKRQPAQLGILQVGEVSERPRL